MLGALLDHDAPPKTVIIRIFHSLSRRSCNSIATWVFGGRCRLLSNFKQVCIAFAAAAVCVTMLSVWPGHAQQRPFAGLPGSWSGKGNITLSSGSHEPISCRATYDVRGSGNDLQLVLRCASDSYNFDFRATEPMATAQSMANGPKQPSARLARSAAASRVIILRPGPRDRLLRPCWDDHARQSAVDLNSIARMSRLRGHDRLSRR